MKKGGTGKPRNPDIALAAAVRMRELHFDKASEPEVCFRGNTRRNSVWESKRENLPDEVQEGVVYRDAEVWLRIASEIVNSNPDVCSSSYKTEIQTNPGHRGCKTGEQETQGREEKK